MTAKVGNLWTATARAAASHGVGMPVRQYYSCPTLTDLTRFTTTADRISAPALRTGAVTYSDRFGNGVDCSTYWSTASRCAELVTPPPASKTEHWTDCDPAVVRVVADVKSTDTGTSRATTSAQLVIRRGG